MFQALIFAVSLPAAMSTQNRAELATKLAEALANDRGFRTATVYVGSLPSSFSNTVPLPKLMLLGSVVETPERPSRLVVTPQVKSATVELQPTTSTTLFYEAPQNAENELPAYEKELSGRGWRPISVAALFGYGAEFKRQRFFCSSRGLLEISGFKTLPRTVAIVIMDTPTPAMWCNAMAMFPNPPSPPPFPTLRAPANTRVGVDVVGATPVGFSEEALVTAEPISVAGDALAHQLANKGWSADKPARSSTGYFQTFHRKQHGLNYQIGLSLVRAANRRYSLTLSETLLDGPPSPIP